MNPSHRHAARILGLGALLASLCAHAQTTGGPVVSVGGDTGFGEPNGIRFGPGRLHPYLDLELRYDSAAGYFPSDPANPNSPVELKPELLMHIRPGFRYDSQGPENSFGLNAYYDYVWYTGILTAGSSAASRSEAGADLHGEFNKEGAVEFDVGDTFARSATPRDIGLGIATISLYNQLRVAVPIHPGGHAFTVKPHGEYAVEFFSGYSGVPPSLGNCNIDLGCAQDPSDYDYQQYSGGVDLHWKFLPQTAALLETSYEGRSYFHPERAPAPPGSMLKILPGLAGLVTPKLSVVLKAGWAQGFSGAASTFIGRAEATYSPNEGSPITLGVLRDVNPVVGAASATDFRAYLNMRTFLIGRLGLHLNFSYDLVSFTAGSATGRGGKDQLFTIDLGPEYQVARWLIVSAGYVFSSRSSDATNTLPLNYSRNEAYIRFTFTY
jgi:hypothetical protein